MVNREGLLFALIIIIGALLVQNKYGLELALPLWLIAAFVFYLFRDPEREIPSSPLAILSPADGRVTDVSEVQDPFVDREAICISINMSALGIYTTRSPTEGKIMQRWFRSPQETNAPHKDIGIWIQTDEQDDVVLALETTSILNAPKCYVHSGERIGQGRKCGYVRFGSKLKVYIPSNCKISVEPGDSVTAGTSVLAHFIHDANTINEKLISE